MAADTVALVISIVCVVISSLTTTFGLFFQKIAQQRTLAYKSALEGSEVISNPKTFRRWTCVIWFAGFLCITIFSFALDLYSMATLGQSLVVPLLACLEVAENQIFAPAVLGERFDKCRDTTASVVVIIGALCTTFFGPGGPFGGSAADPTPDMDYPEMKEYFGGLFLAPVFIVFESATVGLLIACLLLSRCDCCKKLHFLMLGYVAGFLGGQQNMFLKGVGTSFSTGFGGDPSVFADWMVYVFAFFMAALASLQLFFLNVGLAKFQALLFVPTYTILYIVSGTAVGLVFYQEYKLMSNMGWLMFGTGFFFIVAAMAILGTKSQRSTEDEVATFDEFHVEVISKAAPDRETPIPPPADTPPLPPSPDPMELPLQLGQLRTEGCEDNDGEGGEGSVITIVEGCCFEDSRSTGIGSEPNSPCGSSCSYVNPFSLSATLQTVNGSLNGSLGGTLKREAWAAPDPPSLQPARPSTAPSVRGASSKAGNARTDPPRPSTAMGAGDSKAAPCRGSTAAMPERAAEGIRQGAGQSAEPVVCQAATAGGRQIRRASLGQDRAAEAGHQRACQSEDSDLCQAAAAGGRRIRLASINQDSAGFRGEAWASRPNSVVDLPAIAECKEDGQAYRRESHLSLE